MLRREFISIASSGFVATALGSHLNVATAQNVAGANELADADEEADSSAMVELEALDGEQFTGFGSVFESERGDLFTDPFQDAKWAAPALTPELRKLITDKKYWKIDAANRPLPAWAALDRAPDYQHLSEFAAPTAGDFDLSAATLEFLADRNSFVFSDKQPIRIFGLRGCALSSTSEEATWADVHKVRVSQPNHLSCECIIGAWRTADNKLALFRASTVPAASNMFKALLTKGVGASLLPTGKYAFRAGSHKASDLTKIQRGALLMDQPYVVLRSPDDLNYDPYQENDVWTRGVAHNLHSTGKFFDGPEIFDSAGCQVVRGRYIGDRTVCEGPWMSFRRAVGTVDSSDKPVKSEAAGSGTFEYMLLTGLEAALFAGGSAEFQKGYRRIRPGSSGTAVANEIARLKALYPKAPITAADHFDMKVSFATLLDQKSQFGEYIAPIARV